jgi:hypothetical protein
MDGTLAIKTGAVAGEVGREGRAEEGECIVVLATAIISRSSVTLSL